MRKLKNIGNNFNLDVLETELEEVKRELDEIYNNTKTSNTFSMKKMSLYEYKQELELRIRELK